MSISFLSDVAVVLPTVCHYSVKENYCQLSVITLSRKITASVATHLLQVCVDERHANFSVQATVNNDCQLLMSNNSSRPTSNNNNHNLNNLRTFIAPQ